MCEQAQLLVDARVETVVGGWVKIIDGAFVVSRFFSLQKQYMVISFRKNLKIHFVENYLHARAQFLQIVACFL